MEEVSPEDRARNNAQQGRDMESKSLQDIMKTCISFSDIDEFPIKLNELPNENQHVTVEDQRRSENIAVERHNMFSSVPSLVQVDDSLCERRSASDTVTSGQFPDMILIQPPPHIP